MRRILIFVLNLIALATILTPGAAWAADKVTVRTGVHDGYSRIVFAWPGTPAYSAKASANSLVLTFTKAAEFSVDGAAPESISRITNFSTTSTTATIGYAEGQTVRHFIIGNRVIVDIKGKATAAAPKAETQEAENKPVELAEAVKDQPVTEVPKAELPKTPEAPALVPAASKEVEAPVEPKSVDVAKTEPEAVKTPPTPVSPSPAIKIDQVPAPVVESAQPPPPKFDAHMINVTATQAIGMAAFERSGVLWIVLDQENYPIMPQIAGPQKDAFPQFQQVALKGGTAFKMKLPGTFKIYGEGGGLIWKLVLTPNARPSQAVAFKREFDQAKKPGGKLVWPVTDARNVLDFKDPDVGDDLKIVTVISAKSFAGVPQEFVEFGTFLTPVGLVLRPKVDDLSVTKAAKNVTIDRAPNGLAISAESDLASLKVNKAQSSEEPEDKAEAAPADEAGNKDNRFTKIFAFDNWLMGGPTALSENQRIIMSGMASKTDQGKAEDAITLAKMELANGRGPEALGFLDFASQLVKDLTTNPEFIALRGAAEALTGQCDQGFKDFSDKSLDNITEVKYWKSYCLAMLEDWKQAEDVLPKDVSLLAHYPEGVQVPVGLTLAEVSLRAGDTDTADKILETIEKNDDKLSLAYRAALDYLRGESRRQQGDLDGMKDLWKPLSTGPDDLYRAKAGLALTSQLLEKKEIKPEDAINKLEGLRYAWRGDELETAINYKLGRIYVEDNQPIKGLSMLRQAASLAPNSDLGQQITSYLTNTFKSMFLENKIKDLNPIDAVTVYDEFSELIPAGPEGDKISRQLAERLVDADLLPRAENILQSQINGKVTGLEGTEVALRLASIQLLDGKPDKALETLKKAEEMVITAPLEQGAEKRREIALLRARSLSQQNKPEEAFGALALLPQEPAVLKLRADIAWRAKRWQDAADTLEELTNKMNIDMTKPMSSEEADTIMNWAVALYLADNRFVLANLREKYSDAMLQTPLSKKFDVITRPRQNSLLADRATINSIIGETDIFKGFLDGFTPTTEASPVRTNQSSQKK